MMDGLSGAASAIAVVSVALQLADSVTKLIEFWETVKDAPEDITTMVQELKLLELVLKQIHDRDQLYGQDPTTTEILKRCNQKVDTLIKAMESFQPGFTSKKWTVRTWNSFKVTLQSKKFHSFRVSLGEMKTTLILARQDLHQDQCMTAIAKGFTGLHLKMSSSSVTTGIRGTIGLSNHIEDLRKEIQQITTAISNPWVKAGLEMGMDKAIQELAASLRSSDSPSPPVEPIFREKSHQIYSTAEPEVDLEKGNVEYMQPLVRKRLRRRYLENTYTSITSTLFDVVYFVTRKFRIKVGSSGDMEQLQTNLYEYNTHFILHPAQWLLRWGFSFGLDIAISNTMHGWKNNIRTFRAVMDDSLIFEFCKTGNITGVRSLLSRGEASPWDTDSQGWTPLHCTSLTNWWITNFASWTCNPTLCKLLLEAGADKTALTYDCIGGNYEECSPLVTASTVNRNHQVNPKDRVNTLRLFLRDGQVDFTDSEGQDWKMILVLLERERPSSKFSTNIDTSKWVLETFKAELKEDHPMENVAWLLTFALESRELTQKILDFTNNMVDATFSHTTFTPIHCKIAEGFLDSVIPSMKLLAERGANLHRVGSTTGYGAEGLSRYDTPTSLAMRQSAFFFKWRQMIKDLSVDLGDFIKEELE
ncbi:hypothetical protein BP5796_12522 [Coleophoma crateriformis]|uniref:Azaphilone pigments biosynthesis cluster protein L N-terminal domain-containing protein n=1 Tax=Coleophoma crateriformis TaxID=565419 RepID=A0A3D8Q7E2_9HELO|nr:hypothetical protein BP5796_12522 [Coleophoma crateriformis]